MFEAGDLIKITLAPTEESSWPHCDMQNGDMGVVLDQERTAFNTLFFIYLPNKEKSWWVHERNLIKIG